MKDSSQGGQPGSEAALSVGARLFFTPSRSTDRCSQAKADTDIFSFVLLSSNCSNW